MPPPPSTFDINSGLDEVVSRLFLFNDELAAAADTPARPSDFRLIFVLLLFVDDRNSLLLLLLLLLLVVLSMFVEMIRFDWNSFFFLFFF